jgi:hypothetical protein
LLGLRSRKDTMSSSGAGSGALFYMLFELTTSVLMAKRGYDQDQAQHLAAIDLSKRKYLMESFAELEQHFVSLYADLANTTRESLFTSMNYAHGHAAGRACSIGPLYSNTVQTHLII